MFLNIRLSQILIQMDDRSEQSAQTTKVKNNHSEPCFGLLPKAIVITWQSALNFRFVCPAIKFFAL
jgi:hypothetical protein